MRTLRDTLLAAAAALVIWETTIQLDHIKAWPFKDAPHELQALSLAGGDEDWLAVVPNEMLENYCIPWLDRLGVCDVDEYPIAGAMVFIGTHA